jgi:hypothetical protein
MTRESLTLHGWTGRLVAMTSPAAPVREPRPTRVQLDRRVLVGNLVSGALWLLLLAGPWGAVQGWGLFLVGTAYVAAGSVFLAATYGRDALTRRHEALAWAAPWLAAVALWALVGAGIGGGSSGWLLPLWFGLLIGTPCYLAWQIVALAVRQLLAWRSATAPNHR